MYKKEPRYRVIAMDEMKWLVGKFSDAPMAKETAAGEDTSVVQKRAVVEETAIEEKTAVVEMQQ